MTEAGVRKTAAGAEAEADVGPRRREVDKDFARDLTDILKARDVTGRYAREDVSQCVRVAIAYSVHPGGFGRAWADGLDYGSISKAQAEDMDDDLGVLDLIHECEGKPWRPRAMLAARDRLPFRRTRGVLTGAEYRFWKACLKPACDKLGLVAHPKPTLREFVAVDEAAARALGRDVTAEAQALIGSKNVDFLVCDSWLRVVCAVELDDSSHDMKAVNSRTVLSDRVKDDVLGKVGIPLVRVGGKGLVAPGEFEAWVEDDVRDLEGRLRDAMAAGR